MLREKQNTNINEKNLVIEIPDNLCEIGIYMEPKFYILTCAYNCEAFVREAIESVKDFAEHLVIVEGSWSKELPNRSIDNTYEICKNLVKNNTNISLIEFNKYNEPLNYENFTCERHKEWIKSALTHKYYNGYSLQNQLLARDTGIKELERKAIKNNHLFNGYLIMVDADEVYNQESLENLRDIVRIFGTDYDMFRIEGKVFYFDFNHYAKELFPRVFKIKQNMFSADDCAIETPEGEYGERMNIEPELVSFYHYSYSPKRDLDSKLKMWRQDSVEKWKKKHKPLLTNSKTYSSETVHLFEDINEVYSDYRLYDFKDNHPKSIAEKFHL